MVVRPNRRDMALDVTIFENISPSRFLSFTIPNPIFPPPLRILRIAVLDSPVYPTTESQPRVAAMLVPKHRSTDWIFSTESGHLQLLLNLPEIQRLVLIGDEPIDDDDSASVAINHRNADEEDRDRERLERSLKPLVMALSPKTHLGFEISDIPFLTYEDSLVRSVEIEKSVGEYVGEMLVEDVEIEIDRVREFRRRLRFKRMPNLVQTDIRIVPKSSTPLQGTEFRPDLTTLVHPYLAPMVASLSLIGSHVDELARNASSRPKALCIGVGGGALLGFLSLRLGFEVTGVEIDSEVLRVAREHFGLEEDMASVHVEDGIEFLRRVSGEKGLTDDHEFDVVMVDLDSTDPIHGVSAPPVDFVSEDVLLAARSVLARSGILVINAIPPPDQTFYDGLKDEFRKVFAELYEINVGNGENFVLIATAVPLSVSVTGSKDDFTRKKLAPAVPRKYLDTIERI